jgi:hypothetical protein
MTKRVALTSLRLDASQLSAADALIPDFAREQLGRQPSARRASRHGVLVRAVIIGLKEIEARPALLLEAIDQTTNPKNKGE